MNPKLLIYALGAVASLALVGGACGGDDEETSTTSTAATSATTGATGATGAEGLPGDVTASDVLTCLDGAGFEAATNDNELIGVESTYERVDVGQDDLDQAAVIVVFESGHDAQAEEHNLEAAASVADVKAVGNVVWGIDSSADFSESEQLVIEGCLPAG